MIPAAVNATLFCIQAELLATGIHNPAFTAINLSLMMFSSYWMARPAFNVPNAVVHEVCHYLGQDINHYGLKSVKYN